MTLTPFVTLTLLGSLIHKNAMRSLLLIAISLLIVPHSHSAFSGESAKPPNEPHEIERRQAMEGLVNQIYEYYKNVQDLADGETPKKLFGLIDGGESHKIWKAQLPVVPGKHIDIIKNARAYIIHESILRVIVDFSKNAPCLDVERLKQLTSLTEWLPRSFLHPRWNAESVQRLGVGTYGKYNKSFSYIVNNDKCVVNVTLVVENLERS